MVGLIFDVVEMDLILDVEVYVVFAIDVSPVSRSMSRSVSIPMSSSRGRQKVLVVVDMPEDVDVPEDVDMLMDVDILLSRQERVLSLYFLIDVDVNADASASWSFTSWGCHNPKKPRKVAKTPKARK